VLVGAVVGGAVGGSLQAAAGGGSIALIADINNRQLHWSAFLKKKDDCRGSGSTECQVINRIGGNTSKIIDSLALPESNVAANFDSDGNIVSYTILDKNNRNQPLLIMEPAEFEAYRGADQATRGWYLLSPQYSLDIASGVLYAGLGDSDRSWEHMGYVVSSPSIG